MGILQRLLNRLTGAGYGQASLDAESLRIDFRARYHAFKRLLAANRKALALMADMEYKLSEGSPFGMSFVRAHCTGVSVNVLKMIDHLDELSKGKYPELKSRFDDLQVAIEGRLAGSPSTKDQPVVIEMERVNREMAGAVGDKMASLGEIRSRLGLQIPEGFVITATAHERFVQANDLQAEINRRCQAADVENLDRLHVLTSGLQQLVVRARVPDDLRQAIEGALARLFEKRGGPVKLALRSSALGEDSRETSFAGQYRSVLNVSADSFMEAYKEVLASKYAIQAMAYRLNRGLRDEDTAMCVGCLEMVPAVSGGVVYTRSPIDSRDDAIYINAAWGLPKIVVDGSDASDLFVVSRTQPLAVHRSEIGDKAEKLVSFPEEGVRRLGLADSLRKQPSLTGRQACALADVALKIEAYFTAAQDIEWAIDEDDRIHILQCRPLRQAQAVPGNRPAAAFPAENEILFQQQGVTASSGAAAGPVYQVRKSIDMLRFPKGAVMVARQALPVWASLLNRATAVVTEQGGFAGHLANVAREFKVPAIFGVNDALAKLADGSLVTVDADARCIFSGNAPLPPALPAADKALMAGSPIYRTLQEVSRYVVPLNLLDPDAVDFTPRHCKSLHDLTRFIHEKAVREMFSFGKQHVFPERSSKQLYYNVPMQWWVLNLDDGFLQEVTGKYIRLDNICSIPMRAFWEGYVAVPWEGPPPVDGRGLAAVMFRSTMNPALSPGVRSRYADRNYFMISKNYCSLSSRLGYHFSTLEALVGERDAENYISYQFKGGAADYDRRFRRVAFIRDILENNGFRVEVREDNLIARTEGEDLVFMTGRLRVLGYLALHTRQLDMIMANDYTVRHYRAKIETDISRFILSAAG